MKLGDLTRHAGEWLRGVGPEQEVVISSRVRLARNLADRPFLSRCSTSQLEQLQQTLRDRILKLDVVDELFYVDIEAASSLDRALLVERHLISRQLAEAEHPCGVAISGNEKVAIMVNEEDHLRMQVLRSGLQLHDAIQEINRIDDALEQDLDFAYHCQLGYLTACPTNVGTGLRVSVMLHLPALKMTGEIDKAFRAARDMGLTIRGLYGEGTEATGDFFQLSNQTTLGKTEQQISEDFVDELIPRFIDYEHKARRALVESRSIAIDDKVSRALALLRSAKLISSQETLYLLSLTRMGVNLGRLPEIDLKTINELFLLTQPAHLQKIQGHKMDGRERAELRARIVRTRLSAN
ncbi:MAG: protein arginine kinase [Phycisphaerae bacterium]